jgi:hypothetical protein
MKFALQQSLFCTEAIDKLLIQIVLFEHIFW